MKGERQSKQMKRHYSAWAIDESKYLCENEYNTLRDYCLKEISVSKTKKFNKIRNWFMVELGLNTGLRVSEMTSLKHENLLLNNGRSSIKVLGKGNKKRSVWIGPGFKDTCIRFIELKRQFGISIAQEAYLFTNNKGDKITKRSLQKAFGILIIKSGLPNHYHLHSLRHTYTTFLLKASNNNYRFAQVQLGHSSIKTTQIYAGVLESEGKSALEHLYE